ncbi:MAG: phospholipid/cholesterol/gamma-HCH transport system substrate-binding protein [Granulosicoccus sp.]|jgi:phospholipid/cholesterol/gamma-HCH transport system substrate-binding protein
MAKQTKNMIKLGVFVTVGVLLFVAGIYSIGNSKNLFGETITIYSDFRNVKGLQSGNNVRFSGINVGSIEEIVILDDSTLRVNMIIQDDAKGFIKKNAIASIGTDGIVGSVLVNINPRKSNMPPIEDQDVIESYSRVEADDVLQTLGSTSDNIALLSLNLLEMTEKVNEGEGMLSTLLNDASLSKDIQQSVRNIKQVGGSFAKMSHELNNTLTKVQEGEGLLGYLLTDSTLMIEMEEIVQRVDTVIENQVEPIFVDLKKATEEINTFALELQKVTTDLNDGKGAIGTLLKDDKTDMQLKETLKNVNETSIKLNENMEALRYNWFFRRYFRKKAKKEKKKRKEEGENDD